MSKPFAPHPPGQALGLGEGLEHVSVAGASKVREMTSSFAVATLLLLGAEFGLVNQVVSTYARKYTVG